MLTSTEIMWQDAESLVSICQVPRLLDPPLLTMDCKIVARNIQKKFVKFADKFFCGKTKTINKENFKKNVYKRS